MQKTMRVTVTLAIDVDPAKWSLAYGTETAAECRADVKGYVLNAVQGLAPVDEGGIVEVTAK